MRVGFQVKRWFPYGEGNRQCIGMPLARINLQASVASLLAAFRFKLADEVRVPIMSASAKNFVMQN